MVETDWREILSFSQRELNEKDKEILCESLSWMEADDIELNFSDLKSLFRLSQDILKFKSEQVNNLKGQIESVNRKSGKKKGRNIQTESPVSTDSAIETIAHQEEEIKANKDILEQLYADIAELEGRKSKLLVDNTNLEDSDTSRDVLSEMDAVVQLENEIAKKNRHIRKLLGDIKGIEEENTTLKKKIAVLKDKLNEATQIIDNLTEQLVGINNECIHLKEILGKSERLKAQQSNELESLRKELFEKESSRENILEEIKAKVQHWKNIAKVKKSELEALSLENLNLKEELNQAISNTTETPAVQITKSNINEEKIKELQDKLTEAASEIERTASLISLLKAENRHLKRLIEETPDNSTLEIRNQSDDGKERILINKLKKKNKHLTVNLQSAEEIISERERELAEISAELQLLQSESGTKTLFESLKHKTRELKVRDEGIKSLVKDINSLSQQVTDLQLENETMRQKFNIPPDETIPKEGILRKYNDLEKTNTDLHKKLRNMENKLVEVELDNRKLNSNHNKLIITLHSIGYNKSKIDEILNESSEDENVKDDSQTHSKKAQKEDTQNIEAENEDMKALIEENEGLRKGLQEILDFLKDNSTTSSGILSLECPSLEVLLRSMEARHSAGWFAPHMATIMELRAAIGGKDALLVALHEARKETYEVMSQLNKESQKSSELERKLKEMQSKQEENKKQEPIINVSNQVEFGTWIADKESNEIDYNNRTQVDDIINKGNIIYEGQLKKGLEYFCTKFKSLYDKIASLTVQAADDQNKWSILEEQYKAQIENLKSQIQEQEEDEISDKSPGIISIPNPITLQRKCTYLEDSYKYIRTLNENLKNENMEAKKEIMTMASEYETEIHKLILAVANLTDKLRNSISVELFWKQNFTLNETLGKYRKLLETNVDDAKTVSKDLLNRLDGFRFEIINKFRCDDGKATITKEMLSNIEETVLKKQLQELCSELETKNKRIEVLENNIRDLHEAQTKIIDNSLSSLTQKEIELLKSQQFSTSEENKLLKEQCKHVNSQLEIALLQLQECQQRQLSNDMEVNLLRHQILDLQSTGDNKAILSRLSSEVLVAHLQASESYKKIERLNSALNKEKELRAETEEMLKARLKIFDVYSFRYESKYRYMYEVMQVLRQQYQGSIPLISVENYLNKIEDLSRENKVLNEKMQEIEDLRSNLMAKHSVFDQILDVSRNKCFVEEDSCPHKIKTIMMESVHQRELDHVNKKLRTSEQSREDLTRQYNQLEKTLVLVNQGFDKSNLSDVIRKKSDGEISVAKLELEDIPSDEDESSSRRSKTVTLPKPQVLKPLKESNGKVNKVNDGGNGGGPKNIQPNVKTTATSPTKTQKVTSKADLVNAQIQTVAIERDKKHALVQTIQDQNINELKQNINNLKTNNDKQSKELKEAVYLIQQRTNENLQLSTEKLTLETNIQTLKTNINHKDKLIETLKRDVENLKYEIDSVRIQQINDFKQNKETARDENKSFLLALKQMEEEKSIITAEYKEVLKNERESFAKTIKDMNNKIMDLQSKLDNRNTNDESDSNTENSKEIVEKYTMKIVKLEDQCFKLQSDLDECKAELLTYKTEADRWKELAIERLAKMEQLNIQLEERHCHEVDSYKAENQHWLSQLNETQREHMELRSRLTEQKAIYVKQLSEKDSQIEQMRSVINNLKTQIMSMQTMISVHDPSFDLSAIVEVEETSDALSHHGSDRLEIKFDSSGELNDITDDFGRIQSSSTAIWNEPVIERLRRDKQLASKQNAILRRQIKALAARERRSRLDAQNLKNQVFRISTSGSKVTTAETAALHNKIAILQAQLTSARRDTHSSIALWDKWKRAQQASDRWQARYEDKCQEVKKLEGSLNLTKSALSRLDREKRVLMSRLSELKCDNNQLSIEKQESESPEKSQRSTNECVTCMNASSLSNHALLERVQAQQRRIVALEFAEKGNELLVSEYERALAEITSLKGQVLKLESTLLEAQIRMPIKTDNDTQPEIDYWKNYCEMLKEENVQLTLRVNTAETIPTTAHQHRVNDLEQTVLMLRGLVSKLQAEQKSGVSMGGHRKIDSRPNSGRSVSEKSRSQQDTLRIEIANLKRTLQDKDNLLERSKEMLKIAAEREDELLRENAFLRRQISELTRPKEGFLSA